MQKLEPRIQKTLRHAAVISTSFIEKEPYPNNAFTISLDANINPQLAGIEEQVKVQKIYSEYQKFFLYFSF